MAAQLVTFAMYLTPVDPEEGTASSGSGPWVYQHELKSLNMSVACTQLGMFLQYFFGRSGLDNAMPFAVQPKVHYSVYNRQEGHT